MKKRPKVKRASKKKAQATRKGAPPHGKPFKAVDHPDRDYRGEKNGVRC